jgi:glycosyltransferase involved in cell wall biosynthesis
VAAPLVSILVPAYNAAPWVGKALQSALAQTWRRIEVIVVDDGSTDETFALARQFAGPICRVVRQPHRGAAAARNRAYQDAHGDFIQYLDADDLLAPTKVEIQVHAALREKKDALTFSSITHFYDSFPCQPISHPARLDAPEGNPVDFLIDLWSAPDGNMVQTEQWLVPRLLLERSGQWDETLTVDDDGEFFSRVILCASRLVAVPESLAYYRKFRHGASLSAFRKGDAGDAAKVSRAAPARGGWESPRSGSKSDNPGDSSRLSNSSRIVAGGIRLPPSPRP